MAHEHRNSILIVDDETTNINILFHMLSREYTIYVAKDGHHAIKLAQDHLPDLILLDIIMPEMSGYEVLRQLNSFEETKHIPVIFITGLSSSQDEEKGLSMGIVDYIGKPFVPGIVKLRIRNQMRIINYMKIIEQLSKTDALTGLNNRRSFNERLRQEWSRAVRENTSLCVIMLDADHFKAYNDTYGHQQGDVVLQTIANTFKSALKRSADFAARWGGEEFIVLLPSTDMKGGMEVGESIRAEIEQAEILLPDGTVTKVTISLGVNALMPSDNADAIDKFITDADMAMYKAKEEGRNRCCQAYEAEKKSRNPS